jgi:uncharacterized surface protein with fasciclin (FAS1) repeats
LRQSRSTSRRCRPAADGWQPHHVCVVTPSPRKHADGDSSRHVARRASFERRLSDTAKLKTLLTYRVVPGKVHAKDVKPGEIHAIDAVMMPKAIRLGHAA